MQFGDPLEEEFYARSKQNALDTGYRLNEEYDIVSLAVKAIANNKKQYGEWYCYCQQRSGDKEVDKKIICPCVARKRDVETRGACKCALYLKK